MPRVFYHWPSLSTREWSWTGSFCMPLIVVHLSETVGKDTSNAVRMHQFHKMSSVRTPCGVTFCTTCRWLFWALADGFLHICRMMFLFSCLTDHLFLFTEDFFFFFGTPMDFFFHACGWLFARRWMTICTPCGRLFSRLLVTLYKLMDDYLHALWMTSCTLMDDFLHTL